MNLYLKKGRLIGNANLPGGKVGPADEDIKLSKKALEVLDKNIEYLKALGIVIEEKDSNVIDVDSEGNDEGNDEGSDEGNDESPMFDESDWKDNLNESEQEVYEFLKSQTKKELKSDLKSKGISFKSNASEDDLIRLCMEK